MYQKFPGHYARLLSFAAVEAGIIERFTLLRPVFEQKVPLTVLQKKKRPAKIIANLLILLGVPTGIRTPVTGVKGRCPRPLDDGDIYLC